MKTERGTRKRRGKMAVAHCNQFVQNLAIPSADEWFYPEELIALFFPRILEGGMLLSDNAELVYGVTKMPNRRSKGLFWAILAKSLGPHTLRGI